MIKEFFEAVDTATIAIISIAIILILVSVVLSFKGSLKDGVTLLSTGITAIAALAQAGKK